MNSDSPRFAAAGAAALASILFFAILTRWIPDVWPVNLFEAGVFAVLAALAIRMTFSGASLRLSLALIPLAAPVVIGGIQLATGGTVNRWETWNAGLKWAAYLAVALATLQICSSERVRVPFRRALLYFGFGLAIISVLQFFTSPGEIFWMFQGEYPEPTLGPFVSRDRYAAFVELVLPLALFEAFAGKQVAVSYTAMAAAMFASVIAGASRAGSILVVLESVIMLLFMSRSRAFWTRRAGRVAASFVVFAVVFTAVVGWTNLWQRFQDPDPYRGRREMLASAIAMAKERPWTGFGLGTFETVYPAYATFDMGAIVDHAHNDWAEWATEGGLPLLASLLLVAICAARLLRAAPWGLGVLSVFAHSLIDFPMQEPALALWAFALFGAMLADAQDSSAVVRGHHW